MLALLFVLATQPPASGGAAGPARAESDGAGPVAAEPLEVQGHRGARAVLPENTLAAFRHALAAGADVLELDLQITKDDVLVVAHDPRVPPWCSARVDAPFRSLPLAEVRSLDCGSKTNPRFPRQQAVAGARIPTLAEVLALAPQARFNIETKSVPGAPELSASPARWAELVVAALDAAGARGRASVQSFDHRVLHELKKRAPDVTRVALVDETWTDLVAVARAADAQVLSPHHMWLTKDDVTRLHAQRVRVVVWTLNEPAAWARALSLGVDGVITDDPAALRAWLRGR